MAPDKLRSILIISSPSPSTRLSILISLAFLDPVEPLGGTDNICFKQTSKVAPESDISSLTDKFDEPTCHGRHDSHETTGSLFLW